MVPRFETLTLNFRPSFSDPHFDLHFELMIIYRIPLVLDRAWAWAWSYGNIMHISSHCAMGLISATCLHLVSGKRGMRNRADDDVRVCFSPQVCELIV